MKVLSILVASIVLAVSISQANASHHTRHSHAVAHQAPFADAYAYAPDYAYAPVRGAGVDFGGCARGDRNHPDSTCNRQNGNSSQ